MELKQRNDDPLGHIAMRWANPADEEAEKMPIDTHSHLRFLGCRNGVSDTVTVRRSGEECPLMPGGI